MGKANRVALFMVKELAKERERRLKQEAQERERLEKERLQTEAREQQLSKYKAWQKKEDAWKDVFTGQALEAINWEEKRSRKPFLEPEPPETQYVVGQALLAVKMRFKRALYFSLTVMCVFAYGFAETQFPEDLWIYGTVSLVAGALSGGLFLWRRREMTKAEERALTYKQVLEQEHAQKLEALRQEHKQKEDERLEKIEALLQGDQEVVEKTAYRYVLDNVPWPLGVSFGIKAHSGELIEIDISVPGLEMISGETAQWDETKGRMKLSDKPLKDILKQYERMLSAIVLRTAREVFRSCPSVQEIYTSVLTVKHQRTRGHAYDACILSCIVDRAAYEEINFAQVEYLHALENFKLHHSPRPLEFPGDVLPFKPTKNQAFLEEQLSEIVQLDLDTLSGEQFEDVVKGLVERMGFVAEKTQASHDGGIDIWAYSNNALNGGRYIIQCKRWRPTVSVDVVRDLYGTVVREKADGGILITTSDVSVDSHKWVEESPHKIPIRLITGPQLRSLLNEHGMIN
ncbi:MAG: restriction endonuclease [Desulfitobacteriaceae bacterium]